MTLTLRKRTTISISDFNFNTHSHSLGKPGLFFAMNRREQAIAFREAYGQQSIPAGTLHVPADFIPALGMQLGLIEEEGNEFKEAIELFLDCDENEDFEVARSIKCHVIKELADLVFVCEQMAVFLGVDLKEAMNRIFESNMSKFDENGKPIFNEDGKVMKGPNYRPPNLLDLA